MSGRKVFQGRKRGVYLEIVELFDGFRVLWRFLDDAGDQLTAPEVAETEAAALVDAAWHLAMLPLEAEWREASPSIVRELVRS